MQFEQMEGQSIRPGHSMNLNPAPFEMIKRGEKTIELG